MDNCGSKTGRTLLETVNKTAIRDLAVPIADVTSFNTLVQSILDDNPFGCVGYTGPDGAPIDPVVRSREHYTAKVNFIDGEGKRVGNTPCSPDDRRLRGEHDPGNRDALTGAERKKTFGLRLTMGGDAERDNARETYYCQLKCHDPVGVSHLPVLLLLP